MQRITWWRDDGIAFQKQIQRFDTPIIILNSAESILSIIGSEASRIPVALSRPEDAQTSPNFGISCAHHHDGCQDYTAEWQSGCKGSVLGRSIAMGVSMHCPPVLAALLLLGTQCFSLEQPFFSYTLSCLRQSLQGFSPAVCKPPKGVWSTTMHVTRLMALPATNYGYKIKQYVKHRTEQRVGAGRRSGCMDRLCVSQSLDQLSLRGNCST